MPGKPQMKWTGSRHRPEVQHAAVDRTLTLHTQQTAVAAATATKDTRTRHDKTATGAGRPGGRVGGAIVGGGLLLLQHSNMRN